MIHLTPNNRTIPKQFKIPSRLTSNSDDCDSCLFPPAGAGWDAEPPHLPAHPPGGYSMRVQPDHSGSGGGYACQLTQLRSHPAAARHEDLPQPPAGQRISTGSPIIDP